MLIAIESKSCSTVSAPIMPAPIGGTGAAAIPFRSSAAPIR